MSRSRHIHELAIDHEFYDWCNSTEGRTYWEEYAKKTADMNAFQYCMFVTGEVIIEVNG